MSRAAVTGGIALTGVAWAGCGQVKATEFVAGVSSQVSVPNYLQTVVVTVQFNSDTQYSGTFPVYDAGTTSAHVILPRTLGVIKGTEDGVIAITVAGYTFPATDTDVFTGAGEPQVGNAGPNFIGEGGGAVILRRSTQPYVDGQILFVPMPLHFSCYNVDCDSAPGCENDICTCKAGECVPAATDPTTLPPYNDALVYGTTNTCFRPFTDTNTATGLTQPGCMDYEITPQPIGDPSDCIFSLPTCTGTGSALSCSTPGAGLYVDPNFPVMAFVQAAASGGGLNVRAVFDNSVSEVLDYEGVCPTTWPPASGANPQDGYCSYADAPQKFRLAPGLCSQLLGQSTSHEITLLEASGACASKTAFQPICDDTIQGPPQPDFVDGGVAPLDGGCLGSEPIALRPANSALYILFDKSSGMQDFLGDKALAQVLGQSLTNPVFAQTQVALMYPPAVQADCESPADPTGSTNEFSLDVVPDGGGTSIPEGTVPFEFSGLAQADIATSLLAQGTFDAASLPSGSAPWFLEASLAGAYQALAKLDPLNQYNRKAVMIFYDRDFNVSPSNDCAGDNDAITVANQANATNGIETYAVYLANSDYDLPDGGTQDGGPGVPGDPIGHGQQLAQGATPGGTYFFNASQPSTLASQSSLALASVIADLGSCVYEYPALFVPGAKLTFPDYDTYLHAKAGTTPVITTAIVSYATSCALDDGTANPLYVFDNQHIRLCQNTCKRLVTSVTDDEILTAQQNQGRPTPLPQHPNDVTWSYACADVPDAGGFVEAGKGSAPNQVAVEAGTDASPEDAGSEDSGSEDAGTD